MTTKSCLPVVFLLFGTLLAPVAWADAPRQLMWKDLVPPLPADHPFTNLSKQQALQLTDIATVRDRKARGEKVSPIELADEQAAASKLEQAGIDVDGLLSKRKEIAEQRRLRAQSANAALDGQTVRIPGYLLPLEFSGKDITEFLLVPWVGACIHTPPPPPNQIVHVKSDKPVANVALFAPIWVTGQLSTAASKKALYLVDGESNIDIGYSLRASAVEPYKE
ncbi:MAG TPA: DUF3299 domain-containing protein [Burkholderiales bacterium]|nr:DUF3299 domain-containing protein [Burkholderiales bacterium]